MSITIIKSRRMALAVAGLAAGLTAAFTLGPAAANGATTDPMTAQGQTAAGGLACVGPLVAGAGDIVAGSGSAFDAKNNPVEVDWQLRRGDADTDFFADAAVIQTAHSDFFSTSVQPGGKLLPGTFWVCVSSGNPTGTTPPVPAEYKLFLGNGLPA